MFPHFLFPILLVLCNVLVDCASASVHGHSVDNQERASDGSYRPRDADHYGDSGHNVDFDHEAILGACAALFMHTVGSRVLHKTVSCYATLYLISDAIARRCEMSLWHTLLVLIPAFLGITLWYSIGSVREAEEFDKLSPDEAKERLAKLLPTMDLNGDKHVDRNELHKWILNSFSSLSKEEAEERLQEADLNKDAEVTWNEYLQDTFGVDTEEELSGEDSTSSGLLVAEEKAMWKAADINGDGVLDAKEFEVFSNPEDHAAMHPFLVNQTLREKDTNNDGKIDFQEYLGDRGQHQDGEWLVSEQVKFEQELDIDQDGYLDRNEIHKWIIPDNNELAEEEVDHLFTSADDDRDNLLSFSEVLAHHDVFAGSDAGDFADNSLDGHFDDEL